jgi:hypothetical protein
VTKSPPAEAGTKSRSPGQAPAEAKHPRRTLVVGAVVLVLATGATAFVLTSGDDKPAKAPIFVPSTHQVEYEVSAGSPDATAESVQYIIGANNKTKEVLAPKLPFKISLPLEVGPGGGVAEVTGGNGGAGSLSCVLKVDGKVVFAVTAPKETDVGCSSAIAPATQ